MLTAGHRTLTAAQARRIQGADPRGAPGDADGDTVPSSSHGAEHALNVVQKKLSSDLSVEYKINELIQEARNPDNLSRLFSGACRCFPPTTRSRLTPPSTGWQAHV